MKESSNEQKQKKVHKWRDASLELKEFLQLLLVGYINYADTFSYSLC